MRKKNIAISVIILSTYLVSAEVKLSWNNITGNSLPSPDNVDDVYADAYELGRKFPNHPINLYLGEQNPRNLKVQFDDATLKGKSFATSDKDFIKLFSNKDKLYYEQELAHETIHSVLISIYGEAINYGFLKAQDYALISMIDEAVANTWGQWVRANSPEFEATRNKTIQNLAQARNRNDTYDAIENSLRAQNPNVTLAEIGQAFFDWAFSACNYDYVGQAIPLDMKNIYGKANYAANPYYDEYKQYGSVLAYDFFKTATQMLPFALDKTKDINFYKIKFDEAVNFIVQAPLDKDPTNTIKYWYDYDAKGKSLERMKAAASATYTFIDAADENKLNAVFSKYGISIKKAGSNVAKKQTRPDANTLSSFQ